MLFRVLESAAFRPGAALAAAIVAPPLTALIESFVVRAGAPHSLPGGSSAANVDPDMAFRPSAYVAAAGAAFLIVTLLRRAPAISAAILLPRPAVSASRRPLQRPATMLRT